MAMLMLKKLNVKNRFTGDIESFKICATVGVVIVDLKWLGLFWVY